MPHYTIVTDRNDRREAVSRWLCHQDLVPAELRERIVTAWVSMWTSSDYETLEEMPYSAAAPNYRLAEHVNDVIRVGLSLMERARSDWGVEVDAERMMTILTLHDVDKPLMFETKGGKVSYAPLYHQVPHGVLGAMLLKDLGFDDVVVSAVALHSPISPFHARTIEGYILHYADMFSTDFVYRGEGITPFYQRKFV